METLFNLAHHQLLFDEKRSILTFQDNSGNKVWVKRLDDICTISGIIEDGSRLYLAGEIDECHGRFVAIEKNGGATSWIIPGKSYLQLIYEKFLYLIFVDENQLYYFIKINPADGTLVWHHPVTDELKEYKFQGNKVLLSYPTRKETLNIEDGSILTSFSII